MSSETVRQSLTALPFPIGVPQCLTRGTHTIVIGRRRQKMMTGRELDEYRELRATIRQRGTARVWIFVVGVAMWAAATIATTALASTPIATLLPLLVLASVFEAIFALHVGVERIGRYIQVFHETGEPSGSNEAAGSDGIAGSGAAGRCLPEK